MYLDEVTNLVRSDEGLLLYAYTLYEKGGGKAFQEISSKLRSFARLLIEFRNITPFKDASAFILIDPANWDDVIKAAKVLVGHKGDEDCVVYIIYYTGPYDHYLLLYIGL